MNRNAPRAIRGDTNYYEIQYIFVDDSEISNNMITVVSNADGAASGAHEFELTNAVGNLRGC